MQREKETNAVADALGGGKPSEKKAKLHEVSVRKAHSGGFIAKHHYKHADGSTAHGHPKHESEHVLPNMDAVHAHMDEHMGDQDAAEQETPAADAAEQAQGEAK